MVEPTPDVVGIPRGSVALRRFIRHRPAVVATGVLGIIVVFVVIGPLFVPFSPLGVDLSEYRQSPSLRHPLGTDDAGRDVLARVMAGGRVSLTIGLLVAGISTIVGLFLGAIAGFFKGWVDFVTVRLTEIFLSFPGLIAVAISAALFGPSATVLVVVLSLFSWPTPTLIVRAMILTLRNQPYVVAAKSIGASNRRILWVYVIPAVLAPLAVFTTTAVAQAILAEAGLSFLGFGIPPPDPSWGSMLFDAQSTTVMATLPWLWLPPGILIAVTVLSIHIIGDGLRDAADPHTPGAKAPVA